MQIYATLVALRRFRREGASPKKAGSRNRWKSAPLRKTVRNLYYNFKLHGLPRTWKLIVSERYVHRTVRSTCMYVSCNKSCNGQTSNEFPTKTRPDFWYFRPSLFSVSDCLLPPHHCFTCHHIPPAPEDQQ